MRKIAALSFLIFSTLTGFAQMPGNTQRGQGSQMPTGRFYGKVVDASNKGVDAASITLVATRMDSVTKKPKDVIVGGMLTKSTGNFSIENVPVMGRYKLRITGIGYKAYEQPVAFEMPKKNGSTTDAAVMMSALDKDLGNIKIEIDNQVLSGVTVTASKPGLQLGIDRKVFNVDKNLVSAGGTAVDVMKNVPSVNVDIDGNITMRNAAPQIFVDGRPTNMTLEQIPADAIESVEIITNPSAKYDASGGTAGILNIVLKKNKRVGYSGNLRVNLDSRGMIGGGGDINVRQNKVNLFASGMVNQRKSIGTGYTERENIGLNSHSLTFQNDDSRMRGAFGFGRFGFDYFLDNRNTFTLSQSFARGKMRPSSTNVIQTDSTFDGIVDLWQDRYSNSENVFRNMSTQASFKHNFPKPGNEWTADVTYNRSRNESENNTGASYFTMPGWGYTGKFNQQQIGSGKNENLIIQTDYARPINDKTKIEVGARASMRSVKSANNFYVVNVDNTLTSLPDQNIIYNSQDNVYAAYATYSSKFKNFGYQLGLRAESSTYEGNVVNKGQVLEIDFPISLFPSVFLSQKLSDNDDLQLNYSRRINRPGFWQLFPFVDVSDPLNVSHGNPDLKPEFTNSVEVNYSKVFKKNRDNFLATIYFKNTTNLITRYLVPEYVPAYDSVMPVSTYINANQSYVTGLELISKTKMTKWWDMTANANFFTSKIDLENQADTDQFLSYFFKLNNSIRLPSNLTLQISGDYQSKIISAPGGSGGQGGRGGFGGGGMFGGGGNSAAQGYIRPNFSIDAGIRLDFLKEKRASILLNVNDIFRTRKYNSHTASAFFIQDAWRRRDPQVARVNLSWRFGKMDPNLFKRKSTKAEGNINMEGANF